MSHDDQTDANDRGFARLGRRALLKLAGAATLGLPLAAYLGRPPCKGPRPAKADGSPTTRQTFWHGDYCVAENVDASQFDNGIIRARIDGDWQNFYGRRLPQKFVDWNFGARMGYLNGTGPMCLDGPHSGCLATFGANRGDSNFSLNAAFKGFGFFPVESRLDEFQQVLHDNWTAGDSTKLSILRGFYSDQSMWDFRILSSLELYTTPTFETHSFLNQMVNPVATICWLAIPGSYEVRAIPRLMHALDPDLSEIDQKRALWVNSMHDFYHGGGGPYPDPANMYIAVVYHVVEAFDNSPYPGLMGVRVEPPL
jgi:hypothetical protein